MDLYEHSQLELRLREVLKDTAERLFHELYPRGHDGTLGARIAYDLAWNFAPSEVIFNAL